MSEENTEKRLFDKDLAAEDVSKTTGEKIHNELTYRGVDWIANTAFAVSFAYWSKFSPLGQRVWTQRATNLFRSALKPITKNEQTLTSTAESASEFASIVIGGTVIIPPIMVLDKYKRPISEWIDRRIYGDEEVDSSPRFSIRYETMEQQPKKGFVAGMLARGVVLAPMLAGHSYAPTKAILNKVMYQPASLVSRGFARAFRWKPEHMVKEGFTSEAGEFVSKWDYLHTMFGADVSLTFIYSFAHEKAYKSINNYFHGNKEEASDELRQSEEPEKRIKAKTASAPRPLRAEHEMMETAHER